MSHEQRRVDQHLRTIVLGLCFFAPLVSLPSSAQPPQPTQIIHSVTLREMITGSSIQGRDGTWQMYINPGSPYPFGNLGGTHIVDEVCLPTSTPTGPGGVFLSAGQGFGDMVAFTPGGSPFQLGEVDPSGRTELCNPLDTDDTWWFAYGNSLNISPLLTDRFFGNEDTLQIPTCDFLETPVEGVVFLERRSADRQVSDLSCTNRDPNFPLRLGTLLICSFTNTWLDTAGNNIQPILRKCERYLACTNTPFGEVVPPGQLCGQPTPTTGPPTLPPGPGGNPPPPPAPPPPGIGLAGLAGAWTGTFRRDDTGETGAVVTMFTEHNGQLGGWHFQESWVMENVAVSGNTVTFSHVYGQDCRAQHTFTVLNYETREAQSNYTVTCPGSGGHTGTITYRK
jgi:hypothetical protein